MRRRVSSPQKLVEFREFHTPSSGIFFRAKQRLWSEKSAFQQIDIIETDSFGRVLFLDGLVQTTEKDEFFYHEMLVHPALVSHPAAAEVLIIGGGDGGTLKEVLRHPVKKAILVEIDRRVVEVSRKFFPWLAPALADERVELVIADGNAFIQKSTRRFDVILIDSSDPVGPSTVLHQKEFYSRLKAHLKPRGIIAGQAGSPLYHAASLREKKAFMQKMFRFCLYYLGPVP
ncbi:MAG: polyamine aminopropyltransferase, partial [Candidatus Aminicenantes bacterium]|nr:polyamine aminopropyltransferase [Candidatus Aminicenantes bacterium]